jgi:biotin carboxyl carrier protein
MKRYQITLDGRTFDVRLLSDPREEQVQVEVDGRPVTVKVKTVPAAEGGAPAVPVTEGGTSTVAAPAATAPLASEAVSPSVRRVTAPLPGIIKLVAVRPDQRVAVGDELLVIEAMKMDNVIRASREGVIGTVFVPEGRQVAHGEPLLEYRE